VAAAGLVHVFFAQQYAVVYAGYTVGIAGYIAALHTYGVQLGYVFGTGHECGHGAKGLAGIVHIQPGHYHPYSLAGKFLHYIYYAFIKELGLINTHDIHAARHEQYIVRMAHRRATDAGVIMRYYIVFRIAGVHSRLKYLYLQAGNAGTLQPADEFLRFAGEHATCYYFYPAPLSRRVMRLYEHALFAVNVIKIAIKIN
jgi:hypothetical protein